jgi:hypothetical protein
VHIFALCVHIYPPAAAALFTYGVSSRERKPFHNSILSSSTPPESLYVHLGQKEISKGKKEEIYEAADASDSHRERNYVKRNDLHFMHFTAARTM